MRTYRLDYDDAFQYTLVDKFNLTLVSLDADFDHTPRGRQTPAQVLAALATPP
jgi:predicted nucleic acid-binding protein